MEMTNYEFLLRRDSIRAEGASEAKYQRSVHVTVAMAAIGYAFHQTSDWPFDGRLWFILLAAALWAGSFMYGFQVSKAFRIATSWDTQHFDAIYERDAVKKDVAYEQANQARLVGSRALKLQQDLIIAGAVMFTLGQALHRYLEAHTL